MITLPAETIAILGRRVALANNGSFLWRKLSESPTVVHLSVRESPADLLESLRSLVAKPVLAEDDQTTAYVLLVALLTRSPQSAGDVERLPGIKRLYWADSIISLARRQSIGLSEYRLRQSVLPSGLADGSTASTGFVTFTGSSNR